MNVVIEVSMLIVAKEGHNEERDGVEQRQMRSTYELQNKKQHQNWEKEFEKDVDNEILGFPTAVHHFTSTMENVISCGPAGMEPYSRRATAYYLHRYQSPLSKLISASERASSLDTTHDILLVLSS